MDTTMSKTVMVVDDVPANLRLLQEVLQGEGYRVVAFTGGKMALQAARRTPPDLILLDISMPEMDGFEVCAQLKENEPLREVPVVFISALGETADKVKAFSLGGVDYVTKPFQSEEVLARVNTHIQLRQAKVELEQHNHNLEELVRAKVREITAAHIATIVALSKLTESRDYETGKHIERVQHFCKLLAEKLGRNISYEGTIDHEFVDNIYYAAPLHDIGKVGISDQILLKPGKLLPEEFEIIKTHVQIGVETLVALQVEYPGNDLIKMGIEIAQCHHEKWDGSGYPAGSKGTDISLAGRIMALADVYDALRARRPYKDPLSHEKSCEIILADAGRHFDPAVVDAFKGVKEEFAEIAERLKE